MRRNSVPPDPIDGHVTHDEIQGKRLFIKDMAQYLFAPDGKPTPIASSLGGVDEPGNPTVLPLSVLKKFTYTFLIRHPRRSVPSYWRCCVPPQNEITGFIHFMPNEAGYEELRRLFDYLLEQGIIERDLVVVVDADDMLDNPEATIKNYCERTGIDYSPQMLEWDDEDKEHAVERFEKWAGWHDDAIESSKLRARTHAQVRKSVIFFFPHDMTDTGTCPNKCHRRARRWSLRMRSGFRS